MNTWHKQQGEVLEWARKHFHRQLEHYRKSGVITKAEQSTVWMRIPKAWQVWDRETMREVLKCAEVRMTRGEARIRVYPVSKGWTECPRCRRYYTHLYDESGHGYVCERCDKVTHMQDWDGEYKVAHEVEV